jgi:hypothetical protein
MGAWYPRLSDISSISMGDHCTLRLWRCPIERAWPILAAYVYFFVVVVCCLQFTWSISFTAPWVEQILAPDGRRTLELKFHDLEPFREQFSHMSGHSGPVLIRVILFLWTTNSITIVNLIIKCFISVGQNQGYGTWNLRVRLAAQVMPLKKRGYKIPRRSWRIKTAAVRGA